MKGEAEGQELGQKWKEKKGKEKEEQEEEQEEQEENWRLEMQKKKLDQHNDING